MPETKVSEADVLYVADLANLELTSEEKGRMVRDLNSILEYAEMLNELDTNGVPPLAQVGTMFAGTQLPSGEAKSASVDPGYAMRADEVRPGLPNEVALANAPEPGNGFFKVPKVIEK